jgi:hypothetical protein
MTVRFSCSFEFDLAAPVTYRGTVVASSMPTCFARAARQAAKAHPGLHWTSMVVVLLERLQDTPGGHLAADEDAADLVEAS